MSTYFTENHLDLFRRFSNAFGITSAQPDPSIPPNEEAPSESINHDTRSISSFLFTLPWNKAQASVSSQPGEKVSTPPADINNFMSAGLADAQRQSRQIKLNPVQDLDMAPLSSPKNEGSITQFLKSVPWSAKEAAL